MDGHEILRKALLISREVRSEGDYGPTAEAAIAKKRADYFAAGTLVVWDVNLLSDEAINHIASIRRTCRAYFIAARSRKPSLQCLAGQCL